MIPLAVYIFILFGTFYANMYSISGRGQLSNVAAKQYQLSLAETRNVNLLQVLDQIYSNGKRMFDPTNSSGALDGFTLLRLCIFLRMRK